MYQFHAEEVRRDIIQWLQQLWKEEHMQHVVLGISGGKDSTVAAALCIEAFGPENVTGILMPNGKQKDIADSYRVCQALNLPYKVIDVGPTCAAVLQAADVLQNIMRRESSSEHKRKDIPMFAL